MYISRLAKGDIKIGLSIPTKDSHLFCESFLKSFGKNMENSCNSVLHITETTYKESLSIWNVIMTSQPKLAYF